MITNIGTVHAERAGSQEAIARGKAELVEALPPAPEGVAILNYRRSLGPSAWLEKTRPAFSFMGLDPKPICGLTRSKAWDWKASASACTTTTKFCTCGPLDRPALRPHRPARRRRWAGGRPDLAGDLRRPAPGHTQLRLVAVHTESGALLLDDTYNASPESTLAALNLLGELDGRKVAVLGDMLELGPYEARGHEMVGVRAAEIVEDAGDRGRTRPDDRRAARQAGMPAGSVRPGQTDRRSHRSICSNI